MKKKNIILLVVSIVVILVLLVIGHLRTNANISAYVNTIPIKEAIILSVRDDLYTIKRLESAEGMKDTLLLISNNKYKVNDTIICHISSTYNLATEPSCKK